MACRGIHFAIDSGVMARLIAATSDDELMAVIQEEIEEKWEEEWLHQSDKSWDALHRCLSDGTLQVSNDFDPMAAAVLGGVQLYSGDDYIISLVKPENVRTVADAISKVSKESLRERYNALDPKDYDGEIGDEDFDYTWSWFEDLPAFFERAALAGRAVVFTVDQ
jgi:flavin-dependent dehydrogenase